MHHPSRGKDGGVAVPRIPRVERESPAQVPYNASLTSRSRHSMARLSGIIGVLFAPPVLRSPGQARCDRQVTTLC